MNAHPSPDSKSQILLALAQARAATDELFRVVGEDALYERPIPERHRIVFYIGHLEAFDWNLLHERALDLKAFDPQLDQLFAFGIDPVDGGLPSDQPSDWPSLDVVYRYVARAREKLDAALDRTSFDDAASPLLRDGYLLNVAIEHRLMHAETLAYMFHQLPLERKVSQSDLPALNSERVEPRMVKIPVGSATLGLPRSRGKFGWDNEFEAHEVEVPAFLIDAFKVTNRQFLEFLAAGGYEEKNYWKEADWAWKEGAGIRHPGFWVRRGDQWWLRTMFSEIPLPLDWPVYVSHAEASAFARWAGKTLPSEAQWHRAAYATPDGTERDYPWGGSPPSSKHGNFDFHRWNPTPVNAHPAGASAWDVHDLIGNGWEWTSTVFTPFPGFKPFSFYPGYSANFFDVKHYVMKGGSSRTASVLLRRSFRNWFQPHYPYVYAGFRCVREEE